VLGLDRVAVDEFAGEVAVDGVEIEAVAAGQELVDEVETWRSSSSVRALPG
jgi:hypothetical protein